MPLQPMDLATCEARLDQVPNLVLHQTKTVVLEGFTLGTYVAVFFAAAALSTPRLRASWAFRIQFFALMLAFVLFALNYTAFTYTKDSLNLPPGIQRSYSQTQIFVTATTLGLGVIPWLVDVALLFKLVSLFPRWSMTPRKRNLMLAFPVLTLIPRFALFIALGARSMLGWNDPGSGPYRPEVVIYIIISLGLQAAQNIYCSVILIVKAHRYFTADYSRSASTLHARLLLRFYMESFLFSYIPTTIISLAAFLLYVTQETTDVDNVHTRSASRYLGALQCLFPIHFGFLTIFWQNMRGRSSASSMASLNPDGQNLRKGCRQSLPTGSIDPRDRTLLSVLAVDELPAQETSECIEQLGSVLPEDSEWAEKVRDRWRR